MENQAPADNIPEDCQIAYDVTNAPIAQLARSFIILFNVAIWICLLLLIAEYKRNKLAMHGNLKLLYLNIVVCYGVGSLGYFLTEIRHIVLMFGNSNDSCAMLTPAWYAMLSRMLAFYQSYGITITHFAVMIERIRATFLAHNYEFEGTTFGKISVIFVSILNLLLALWIGSTVLVDWKWELAKMLPANTMVTKNSNQLVININYAMLLLIALTALGDYILYRMNKQRRSNTTTSRGRFQYNLSENYQLSENINAMRLILPLDIAYMLCMSLYLALVICLRMFQPPTVKQSTFLAYYNFITCPLLGYAIISLILYRKFLRITRARLASNVVAPQVNLSDAYFQQFQAQWE